MSDCKQMKRKEDATVAGAGIGELSQLLQGSIKISSFLK